MIAIPCIPGLLSDSNVSLPPFQRHLNSKKSRLNFFFFFNLQLFIYRTAKNDQNHLTWTEIPCSKIITAKQQLNYLFLQPFTTRMSMLKSTFHSPQFLQETYTDASGLSNFQKSASSVNESMFGNIQIIMLCTITIALNAFYFFLKKLRSTI